MFIETTKELLIRTKILEILSKDIKAFCKAEEYRMNEPLTHIR